MPFYRIRIWLKNRKAPVQGIRFIELNNIEQVQNKIQIKAGQYYYGSQLVDVEVAMLSKNCSAVKKNLITIMKKSVDL
jgi:hypothetical protein